MTEPTPYGPSRDTLHTTGPLRPRAWASIATGRAAPGSRCAERLGRPRGAGGGARPGAVALDAPSGGWRNDPSRREATAARLLHAARPRRARARTGAVRHPSLLQGGRDRRAGAQRRGARAAGLPAAAAAPDARRRHPGARGRRLPRLRVATRDRLRAAARRALWAWPRPPPSHGDQAGRGWLLGQRRATPRAAPERAGASATL